VIPTARLRRPPGGDAWGPAAWREIAARRTTSARLAGRLALRLGADRVWLLRSGREAMRRGFEIAARATGRSEVLIPGYCCFSVPAAAVAAGLRVRLVDVDADGRIDLTALSKAPLEDVAAIVVCNLFGRGEPIDAIRQRAAAAGAWVVDDAAQAFGATAPGATGFAVGARTELGVLSFGRGKPLSGLGGGALVLSRGVVTPPADEPADVEPAPRRAALAAMAWDLALRPSVFSLLARIPALGIGETPFEPDFERGAIDGASLVLTDHALDAAAATAEARAGEAGRLARDLRERTRFEPIVGGAREHVVYPRLAVRAPDEAARGAALAALVRAGTGASGFYPAALSRLPALEPHRVDEGPLVGAERLAGRLFTLPVNGSLRGSRWGVALEEMSRL